MRMSEKFQEFYNQILLKYSCICWRLLLALLQLLIGILLRSDLNTSHSHCILTFTSIALPNQKLSFSSYYSLAWPSIYENWFALQWNECFLLHSYVCVCVCVWLLDDIITAVFCKIVEQILWFYQSCGNSQPFFTS